MIDSIYTGVTGVQSHQTRLNVISNNVANINTIGFKSGRASFADVMSRTLDAGRPARGPVASTNPRQSGLGVGVSSIDTMQTQGALQTTESETDLAIQGEGFFILGTAGERVYTRDGSFSLDLHGRLYDPATGLVVQGTAAAANGVFGAELQDIVVPLDRESRAEATTMVAISGNLDASAKADGAGVWDTTTRLGLPARVVSEPAPGFPLDLSGLEPAGLQVKLDDGDQARSATLNIPGRVYAERADLVETLNAQVSANGTLRNRVFFTTDDSGALVLRSVPGGSQVTLSVEDAATGDSVAGRLGFASGAVARGASLAATDGLNALANIGAALTDGDVLRFSGVKPTGEAFDGRFVFEAGQSDTVQDLLTAVENVYGGVRADIDPDTGRLTLTDTASGDRVTGFDLRFSLLDTGPKSGIFGNEPPYEYSTTARIYDAQGESHTLTLRFVRSVVSNEWNWTASVDGITPDQGHSGKAVFNADGTLRSFASADGSRLSFTPAKGAPPIQLTLDAAATGQLGGLTQFVSASTASVREQDGRASGSLVGVSVESDGSIVGLFSNGSTENLARVAMAAFANPGGMRQIGSNMFVQTQSSGRPVVGAAENGIQGSIVSGALEMSNVDLATEFTNMVVTQRGFQASARSITTSDELLNEVVNLKR